MSVGEGLSGEYTGETGSVEVVGALLAALEAQWVLSTRVSVADLARPSRCPGWSVFDVMNHSVGVTLKFTEFASDATDRPRSPGGDLIGSRPAPALRKAADSARTAWSGADMSRACQLPFGTFPAVVAAGINLVDVLAHGWDVGVFGDAVFHCPDEVWSTGLEMARSFMGPVRDPRHYGTEITVPETAPSEQRLLGFLGRA
jgi:uncharacterized protein (TIGR03086 family)